MVSRNVRNALLVATLGIFVAGAASAADTAVKAPEVKTAPKPAAMKAKAAKPADEVAVLETSKGRMVVEFWEKDAPQTVANFKKLARQGYYDGTGFHRIMKNFMIQGGDPKSKSPSAPDLGTGGPGYTIKDEFNTHLHVKGVLSMANTGTPNSAGSQFFIMHGTAPTLDGHYTAFGHLTSGMDVLEKIASSPTGPNPSMPGENSKPMEWTTLKSVKIMSKASYAASIGSKKADAMKPAEVKSSMGGGAGMDMKAATPPAESSKPAGAETVDKAKAATQTPPENKTEGK
jgi:peptidyl-prolyl cis-trans isomerase B (cyclophilin B)